MFPAAVLLAGLPLACRSPAADPTPTPDPLPAEEAEVQGPPMPFEPPETVASLQAPGLTESSGLAASQRNPGTWWTLNDSGNDAALYRFDLQGRFLGLHEVPGVDNRDWEDLAAGSCPSSPEPCLYIAEIGDNKEQFEWVAVYAVREPQGDEPAGIVATWIARYPNGARNAETLLLHPESGRLYLVTKEKSGLCEVYRFPAEPSEAPGLLERAGQFQLEGLRSEHRKATAGDWSPDGTRVVVRTYMAAWEWDTDPSKPEAHWAEPPRRAWLAVEDQGEAIAYTPDGHLITTSEGAPMPINIVRRSF